MHKKRILLMYISKVSGHRQAALAIENALKLINPHAETLNINAFRYTNPISEKIIDKIYMWVLNKAPGIWEYLYDNPKIIKGTQKIKERIHFLNSRKLKKLYDEFKPDAIICTQAFPCGMAADFKKIYNLNIPLFAIVTDYLPHSYWVYPEVDFYIVGCHHAKEKLLERGVSDEKIKLFGIPIDPKFNKIEDREKIANLLNLDLKKPVILAMGGGQGFGPIKKIIMSFKKITLDLQLIVVAGTNKKLFHWLKKQEKRYPKKMLIFGFTDKINQLMSVADLIITKPGGLTTAEALTKGIPMIIVNPIPGQEEHNTRHLLKEEVALRVNNLKHLNNLIENLFTHKQHLEMMHQKALKISHPDPALKTAELILNTC